MMWKNKNKIDHWSYEQIYNKPFKYVFWLRGFDRDLIGI